MIAIHRRTVIKDDVEVVVLTKVKLKGRLYLQVSCLKIIAEAINSMRKLGHLVDK